jgi:hypothetical protein
MRRVGLGALALVLLAVLVVLLKPWSDDDGDRGDKTGTGGKQTAPAAATGHRELYRIRDAVPAVEGEDYRVLHEIPGPIGYKADALLPDGDLVLVHRHRWNTDTLDYIPDLLQIWDPETGARETVPTLWPGGIASVTATSATDIWATFGIPRTGYARKRAMLHYDRATGRATLVHMPEPVGARSRRYAELPQIGGDGRIYFVTGRDFCDRTRCSTPDDRELWSFDPEQPEAVRKEAGDVGYFAASARLLAWTETPENLEDSAVDLHLRRAGSSKLWTVSVPCWDYYAGPPIQVTDDLVYLNGCGMVYDDRAKLVTDLNIYTHGLSGVTDSWIARGWTLWHPRTGRLLRTADDRIIWHNRPIAMNGDLILLPSLDGRRHTRNGVWRLVRMSD